MALEVLPHLHPRRIFGSFLCAQTGTRRQAKPGPGKPGWLFLPFLLALSKEMGSGKSSPKTKPLDNGQRVPALEMGKGEAFEYEKNLDKSEDLGIII